MVSEGRPHGFSKGTIAQAVENLMILSCLLHIQFNFRLLGAVGRRDLGKKEGCLLTLHEARQGLVGLFIVLLCGLSLVDHLNRGQRLRMLLWVPRKPLRSSTFCNSFRSRISWTCGATYMKISSACRRQNIYINKIKKKEKIIVNT